MSDINLTHNPNHCCECVSILESRNAELEKWGRNALSVLEDLNDLNWEPQGRPFNWDEVIENLEAALSRPEEKR